MLERDRRILYRLEPIDLAGVQAIHAATLAVLADTGALFEDPEAVELLVSHGAKVNGTGRVSIPPGLVEQALASAPSVIGLYTRDGRPAMHLARGTVYCGTGSDCPYVLDFQSGERRLATKRDIESFARLSDALPNIDFVMSMGLACDVPTPTADLHHFQAMVSNTLKPVCFTAVRHENLLQIVDLAAAIAGGREALQHRPFLILYAMPSPPLRHSKTALRNLVYCARQSIPVVYGSGTAMGLTGPMSVAGGTVSSNCDVLAGLVVHQLANPGAPFIYGVGVSVLDMQTTIDAYGAPEHYLADVVNAQVAHHYHLPSWGYAGDTDSKTLDLQAGLEYLGSTLLGMLSNCNLLHDVGYLEAGLTASCESLVLGNEVVEFARCMLQPVPVTDDTLAVESIKRAGPGGTFLMEELTLKAFRSFWYSPLIDRKRHDGWAKSGSLTMYDRVKSRAGTILATHRPLPLDGAIAQEMAHLIAVQDAQAAG
jgi:trimethylamine--corrinoid protein Co-methyltransferase